MMVVVAIGVSIIVDGTMTSIVSTLPPIDNILPPFPAATAAVAAAAGVLLLLVIRIPLAL